MERTKYIYIFGYKFTITSNLLFERQFGKEWKVKVSLGKLSIEHNESTDTREDAEEAVFGYFLNRFCQGGIFWKEPTEDCKKELLAERIAE